MRPVAGRTRNPSGLLEQFGGRDDRFNNAVTEQYGDQQPGKGEPHAAASSLFSAAGSWNLSGTAVISRLATKPTASTTIMMINAGR